MAGAREEAMAGARGGDGNGEQLPGEQEEEQVK